MSRYKKNKFKKLIYDNLWILILVTPFALLTNKEIEIISIILGIFYFLNQQKMAEEQFFQQCFKDFNHRYDLLNDNLSELIDTNIVPQQSHQIVDYFNLCAEEYLLYQKGYIPNEIWLSWTNGMGVYWKNKNIRDLWKLEKKSNSYYGFDLASIAGAR